MLGKSGALGKWKSAKSWQVACNQSNDSFTNGLAVRVDNGARFFRAGSQVLPNNVAKQRR
jgi:UDP-galactopyranose mutase